jgi:hypothetical protein
VLVLESAQPPTENVAITAKVDPGATPDTIRLMLRQLLIDSIEEFVIDQTGLKGDYYFGFKFRRHNHVDADAVDAPVVFEAIEDELGLTLTRTAGPVEFPVVDRAEKVPIEN